MSLDTATVLQLAQAALSGDGTAIRRTVTELSRQLAGSGDIASAQLMRGYLRKRAMPLQASSAAQTLPVDYKSRLPLLEEQALPTSPIFLSEQAGQLFRDFVWDARHIDRLTGQGIAGRMNLLLSGAPGTGKTSLAGHVASALNKPLFVVRLDSLVSSLLGDTSKNVRSLFDYFTSRGGILFLDEMDAIAKLRDDKQELGELKRVVNTVLQGLDSVDESTVIIGATNHPQLLDPAIWRRFPYRLEMSLPDRDVRRQMWDHFLFQDAENEVAEALADISDGLSGADIQAISYTARRHAIVSETGVLDIAAVSDALLRSAPGTANLPARGGVSQDRRRELAIKMAERGLNAPRIGELLGVSRQWALKLLKDGEG